MRDDQDDFDIQRALDAIDARESEVKAWKDLADRETLNSTAITSKEPLAGVPFGVKDVIDVAGFQSRFGSAAFEDVKAAITDSPMVASLRTAGAVPIGKTRSTEFAFLDPTISTNPFDSKRTPGGSSSGSGAAVGASMVPFTLGTQTAGSLCRPAAYCGAMSYKPSIGLLPQTGMSPLAPSFDSIGVIARSTFWLESVFDVWSEHFNMPETPKPTTSGPLKIGIIKAPEQEPGDAMQKMLGDVANKFVEQGHQLSEITPPVPFGELIAHHGTIMYFEIAHNLIPFVGDKRPALGPKISEAIDKGVAIERQDYDKSIAWLTSERANFWAQLSGFDLLIALPVPGAAPIGLTTTGDQSYITPWTALGGPLVSVPTAKDPDGMPLGVMLAAAPGMDRSLMAKALPLAGLFPPMLM